MSQEPLNSPNNINIAHGVSAWFQKDFTGDRVEFGDFVLESFTPAPEFLEHFSYRDGLRATRKRLLTQKAATMAFTLNEPSLLNLQRAAFGGDISSGNAQTLFEARQGDLQTDTGDELFIDVAELDPDTTTSNITVTGVFELTDSLQEFGMAVQGGGVPDGNGNVAVANTTETTAVTGDTVNVVYTIAETNLFKSEIFGASGTSIEGALQVQLRNQSGGIMQVYDLASASLSANGDIPFPLDAVQTIPLIANLQERGGTFGSILTK
jgi:hypothetical protein